MPIYYVNGTAVDSAALDVDTRSNSRRSTILVGHLKDHVISQLPDSFVVAIAARPSTLAVTTDSEESLTPRDLPVSAYTSLIAPSFTVADARSSLSTSTTLTVNGRALDDYSPLDEIAPGSRIEFQVGLRGGLPAIGSRPMWKLGVALFALSSIILGVNYTQFPFNQSVRDMCSKPYGYQWSTNTEVGYRVPNSVPLGTNTHAGVESTTRLMHSFHLARRLENARWITPRGTTEDVILGPDGATPVFYPDQIRPMLHDAVIWMQGACHDPAKFWDSKFFNNSLASWQDEFVKVPHRTQRHLRVLALEDELNWLRGTAKKQPLAVPLA